MRGKGAILRSSLTEDVTPEKVRESWINVVDMSKSEQVDSITEATGSLVELLDKLEGAKDSSQTDFNKECKDEFTFGNKDLILYALGGKYACLIVPIVVL